MGTVGARLDMTLDDSHICIYIYYSYYILLVYIVLALINKRQFNRSTQVLQGL